LTARTFVTQWKARDGIEIFVRGWEPEARPRAVICLEHGLGEHTDRYAHVADAMCAAGHAMLGADLRGHGRSGGQRGHAPSMDAYIEDFEQLLGEARTRYPGIPVFLYGHSLGAILMLAFGLRRRPDLPGAILTAPALHTNLEEQRIKVIMARILGTLMPKGSIRTGLDQSKLSHDPAVVQAYRTDPLVHDKASLGWGKMMLETNRWILQNAADFPMPLLLMHGGLDVIAYPSSSRELAASLGSRVQLVIWDKMLHEIHNEPEKAAVLQTMTDWLDARLKQA